MHFKQGLLSLLMILFGFSQSIHVAEMFPGGCCSDQMDLYTACILLLHSSSSVEVWMCLVIFHFIHRKYGEFILLLWYVFSSCFVVLAFLHIILSSFFRSVL